MWTALCLFVSVLSLHTPVLAQGDGVGAPLSFDCTGRDDGDYPWFPEGGPCEHEYARCVGGQMFPRTCGRVLYFDMDTGRCLKPEYVRQCGGKPTTTTASTTTTTPTTTTSTTTPSTTTTVQSETPPPRFDCRGRPDGLYPWFPDGPCEHDYAKCVDGFTHIRSCGALYFDPSTGRCDEARYVKQCGGKPTTTTRSTTTTTTTTTTTPTTTTTTPTTTTTTTTPTTTTTTTTPTTTTTTTTPTTTTTRQSDTPPPPTFDCRGRPDGLYAWFADGPCEHDYAKCVDGVTHRRTCGALYFDPSTGLCDEAGNVKQCGGGVVTTTESTTTVIPDDTTTAASFDCSKLPDGDYPWYPNGPCEQEYATCHNGDLIGRRCPADLYFDEQTGLCLYPRYVASCGGIATTITPEVVKTTRKPVDFDCSKRGDGYYTTSDCSNVYYSCSGGVAELHACGAKNTFYDIASARCQYPHCLPACGGDESLCTAVVPEIDDESVTEIKVGKPFDCRYLDDGDYELFEGECTRVYASCVGGQTYYRLCQEGLYFDSSTDSCYQLDYVVACGGSPKKPEEVKPPTVIPPVGFNCGDLPNGYYPAPNGDCSPVFYSCTAGVPRVHRCPGTSTYWDQASESCQFAIYTEACGGESTTVVPSDKPEALTTPSPFDCYALEDGDYPWVAGECAQLYASCTGGNVTPRLCQSGLVFDVDTDMCEHRQYVVACGGAPTTTKEPEETTAAAEVAFDCKLKPFGNYPDPDNACSNVFFTCAPVGPILNRCPGNTFFDTELNKCDYYTNVPACTGTPRPEPTTTTTTKRPPVTAATDKFDCSGRDDGPYPAGRCLNIYYECFEQKAYVTHCGTDQLRFSEGKCVSAAKVAECN